MSDFLQLSQRVRQETGTYGLGPTSVIGQRDHYAQIVAWTAQACADVCREWVNWAFLWSEGSLTLASGTATYSPEADCRQINEDTLYISGGSLGVSQNLLEYIPFDDYRRMKASFTVNGLPWAFTVQPDGLIKMLPTPDAAYTVSYEYWAYATALTADDSVAPIPVAFEDVIVWKAAMYWAAFNEAEAEYQKFASNYVGAFKALEAAQLPAPDQWHARSQGVNLVVETE